MVIADLITAIFGTFNSSEEKYAAEAVKPYLDGYYFVAKDEIELRKLALTHTDLIEPE